VLLLLQILFFVVPQAVTCEGCYSSGNVTVTVLPEKVFGAGNRHTFFLRRTEGLIEAEELQDMITNELSKVGVPVWKCLQCHKNSPWWAASVYDEGLGRNMCRLKRAVRDRLNLQ
jgi:hypothetical protein